VGFEVGRDAHLVLGHSVGEFSALCAANSLRFEDALKITVTFKTFDNFKENFKRETRIMKMRVRVCMNFVLKTMLCSDFEVKQCRKQQKERIK
jgi:hypothetical protein